MKFYVQKKDLAEHLQNLISIVPGKNAMPILINYLIKADEEKGLLTFVVSNLEVIVSCEVEARIIEGGSTAINAKHLNDIVNSLPESEIAFFTDDNKFHIVSEHSRFALVMAQTEFFPAIPTINSQNQISLDVDTFKIMIQKTIFATSTDRSKPVYTGVYWKITPEEQTMVATDGKKLAKVKINSSTKIDSEKLEYIVPSKTLSFVQKIIDEKDDFYAYLDKTRIVFKYKNYTIFTTIIINKYPKYEKVIPQDNDKILIVNKNLFLEVIKRVSLLSNELFSLVTFDLSKTSFTIYSEDEEEGEAKENITEYEYEGEPIKIAFNYRYLSGVISLIDTEKVQLLMKKYDVPALFLNYPNENENIDILLLLMPLGLQEFDNK